MASRIRRRSGAAFVKYMRLLEYVPKDIMIVGTGGTCEEAQVFREEWDEVEIYGMEANPRAADAVEKNFPGTLFRKGAWSSKCEKEIYTKKGWMDGTTMFEHATDQAQWKSEEVECVRLDDIGGFRRRRDGGVLWLDVEGAELDVLIGSQRKFIKHVDVVNVEMTLIGRGDGWCRPRDVHNWLESKGFLHAFIHSIRADIGQRDAIYLHQRVYNPEVSHVFNLGA